MFRLPIGAGLTVATHLIMFVLGAAFSSLALKAGLIWRRWTMEIYT